MKYTTSRKLRYPGLLCTAVLMSISQASHAQEGEYGVLMNTAQQAVDYTERLTSDNVVIHMDTYHMHIEESDFESAFATAAPYLGYVHVSESNRGTPGSGMVDWAGVMQGLAAIDYSGTLTLESMNHVDVDIAGALAIWRPVADNPDDVISKGLPFLKDIASRSGLAL